jgi:fructose-bisphosphate aldolase class 1
MRRIPWMHEMRVRIVTAPAFTGAKVIAAILFEGTMDALLPDCTIALEALLGTETEILFKLSFRATATSDGGH